MRNPCDDCGQHPASFTLPDGRHLCRHCRHELSARKRTADPVR